MIYLLLTNKKKKYYIEKIDIFELLQKKCQKIFIVKLKHISTLNKYIL